MNAGLPGFGLGGLFFIVCALLAPVLELARTARGRSSRERWRMVGRHFAIAVGMIAAIELTLSAVRTAIVVAGISGARSSADELLGPLVPAAITAILLVSLLLVAKGFAVVRRAQLRRR